MLSGQHLSQQKSYPQATAEFDRLKAFAAEQGHSELKAWDVAYYAEKLRLEKFSISDEELRPYFPLERVMDGLFEVMQKRAIS